MNPKISTAVVASLVLISGLAYSFYTTPIALSAPGRQATASAPTPVFSPTSLFGGSSPTPGAGERTYTVVAGDNPWGIAQKVYGNGSKYPEILKANNLTESSRLTIGQVLVIPPLPGSVPVATATPSAPIATAVPSIVSASATPVAATRATPTLEPTATPTELAVRTSQDGGGGFVQVSTSPDVALVLDILGWICTLSSLICAFLAYQAYHRVRRLQRMMIMSQRARARL
jgi:LysM repeat protein